MTGILCFERQTATSSITDVATGRKSSSGAGSDTFHSLSDRQTEADEHRERDRPTADH